MNVQLTVVQLWALVAGGPIAMVLTVLVGILVNNAVTGAKIAGLERGLAGEMEALSARMDGLEASLNARMDGLEASLKAALQRVEGVLSARIDTLSVRVKSLEDQVHSPLVKS